MSSPAQLMMTCNVVAQKETRSRKSQVRYFFRTEEVVAWESIVESIPPLWARACVCKWNQWLHVESSSITTIRLGCCCGTVYQMAAQRAIPSTIIYISRCRDFARILIQSIDKWSNTSNPYENPIKACRSSHSSDRSVLLFSLMHIWLLGT